MQSKYVGNKNKVLLSFPTEKQQWTLRSMQGKHEEQQVNNANIYIMIHSSKHDHVHSNTDVGMFSIVDPPRMLIVVFVHVAIASIHGGVHGY